MAKGISCTPSWGDEAASQWQAGWLVPVAAERSARRRKVMFAAVGYDIHMSVAGGSIWRNDAENYEKFIPFGLHRDWLAHLRELAAGRAEFFLAARVRRIAEPCFLTTDRAAHACRRTVVVRLAFETFAELPAVKEYLAEQERGQESSRAELAEIRQRVAERDWVDLNQLNEPAIALSSQAAEPTAEAPDLTQVLRNEAQATKPRAGDRLPIELELATMRVPGVLSLEHPYDERTFGATLFLAAAAGPSLRGSALIQELAPRGRGDGCATERCLIGTIIE